MAELDTSMYKTTPPPPLDPLRMFGQVVGIQNAQSQNRLLQQGLDMRAGLAQQYTGATDPTTGAIDYNRLLAGTAADPRTAGFQGDIDAQAQSNIAAKAAAQKAQLETGIAHIKAVNAAGSALISDPKLGVEDRRDAIVKSIMDLSNHGDSLMTGKIAKATADSIPFDPAGQLQWVKQKMAENDAYAGQFNETYKRRFGTDITVGTGQQIFGGKQNMETGGLSVAGPGVQQVTGPDTNAALQKITVPEIDPATGRPKLGPDGRPTGLTQEVYVRNQTIPGASGVAGGGAPPAQPAAAPPSPLDRIPNRLLTTPAAPKAARAKANADLAASQRTAPTVQPAAPPGAAPIMAGPPPGVGPQLAADQSQYFGDLATVPKHVTNVQNLDLAREASQLSDQGKSTGATHALYSFLNAQGMLVGPLKFLQDDVKNYDVFNKLTTDYAAKAAGSGGLTDLSREMSTASNAGVGLSKAANDVVMKKNIGLENQAIASVMEQKDKTGAGHIGRTAKFANDTDPHAFAWDRYTDDEQKAYLATLQKNGGMEKFGKSLEIAHRHNLIAGPPQ